LQSPQAKERRIEALVVGSNSFYKHKVVPTERHRRTSDSCGEVRPWINVMRKGSFIPESAGDRCDARDPAEVWGLVERMLLPFVGLFLLWRIYFSLRPPPFPDSEILFKLFCPSACSRTLLSWRLIRRPFFTDPLPVWLFFSLINFVVLSVYFPVSLTFLPVVFTVTEFPFAWLLRSVSFDNQTILM